MAFVGIGTLRATTETSREQDWLKTNLAKFSGMMQGQRDLITLGSMLLSELAPLVKAQQGLMYVVEIDERTERPRPLAQHREQRRVVEDHVRRNGLLAREASAQLAQRIPERRLVRRDVESFAYPQLALQPPVAR